MSNKYWQSFGEVNDPENFQKRTNDEFHEELPFEGFDDKGLIDAKAPRRDFLKYLGFSTAAATLAASCKIPVRKAIPYANKPENMVPGVAKFYATTYVQDGDVIPVLAKVRDGRPIKIEGNGLAFTGGGTSARAQASVLDLYDMYRLKFPQHRVAGGKDGKGVNYAEVPAFDQFDKMVGDAMKASTGSVVLLTGTIVSPTTKEIITKFPNLRHVQYDADSYSGMLLANEASGFGRKIPTYNFASAKVIVSLGADFLGTWISPVEYAKGYSKGRKIDEKNPSMNKHYQFEGHLSMTGSNADERFTHRPSETGAVALALAAAVGVPGVTSTVSDTKLQSAVTTVAEKLKAANGEALVVCGSNDKNIQLVVNAINNAIGAYGKTIDWSKPVNYRQGIDADMNQLVADMEAGAVGTLMICGANPAYNYHSADKFKAALQKVRVTVSFNEKMDETTKLCEYILPTNHYLESWGDAEAKPGMVSFIQPTIYPLFKTRPYQTSLLKWSGDTRDYETYFKEYWVGKLGSELAFNTTLQAGVKEDIPLDATAGAGSYNAAGLAEAASAISSYKKGTGIEIIFYQKVSIGTGSQAGNPWLQELPDPVSKATWDNYALISVSKAKELGIKLDNDYEYYPQKPVITFTIGNKDVDLPILAIPGMNADTIAVAVGYGRNEEMGVTAAGVGTNVYGFTSFNGTNVDYLVTGVKATNNNKQPYKIAQMQKHNSYEDRKEVVRETTLAAFKASPNVLPEYRDHLREAFYKNANNDFRQATLYPQHDQPGIKWGMNIDMNACFGCGACVVACHAENNVPVVGKREVLRYHDMHWLRIDRYFISDEKDPDNLKGVVFQPMLCQHCDNAPCENVCPVAATNHSAEGINQMAYNRCIGTRYCANNCPFKVRRFNWADYMGADSFPDNRDQQIVGKLDSVVEQMNDDLTRMVLNPDVTVRSRGVMEKCSFCIQKLQAAKLDAKKENRMLKDGDAKTACQMACSADAIVFGNVHDRTSAINKVREENKQRTFLVLDQLHVLPNITYLAKVRNTEDPDKKWNGEHKEEEHKTEAGKVAPAGTTEEVNH